MDRQNGPSCKKLYEYESFEEFKAALSPDGICTGMEHVVCQYVEMRIFWYFPCIAASTMMDGCLESKDVTESKCNRLGMTACGTVNVADGLMAIKKLFDNKSYPCGIYDAVMNNWEGYEQLRQTVS